MLQSVESNESELELELSHNVNGDSNSSKHKHKSFDTKTSIATGDYDEPTRIAIYLFNCAKKFLSPTSTSPQVLPAIKCLYMALSMVLAPQFEVEIRLMLGNVLLDQTQNFNEALDQIQKAYQLAESSLGAIKFEEKCKISRSLIDALIRTNSFQLAHNILETICSEALQVQTPAAWQWFLHFSLMNLQSKLDNKLLLHQALSDTDEILKIIQNHQSIFDSNEEWKCLLASSKVLILSFLLLILTDDRKILSVFSILPKAIEELSQAITELNCCIYFSDSGFDNNFKNYFICLCTAFFAESLILLNSLAFSNSQRISTGIENLLNLFKFVNEKNIQISELKLPGHLIFFNFDEFRLLGDFITLLTLRQSPSVTFLSLQKEIERLVGNIKNNNSGNIRTPNSSFSNNLLMALNSFKSCLDLESGIINQNNSSKSPTIGDLEFNKKFREFLLSFTAHAVVKRLGVPKVTAFYDHKIKSTLEVDLKNLLILNRLLLLAGTNKNSSISDQGDQIKNISSNEIENQIQNLQIITNSVSFYLIRAMELQNSNSPAHHIRNCLLTAEEIIKNQLYHEPKLECILNILLGEFHFKTDLELSRNYLQSAFNTAQQQLSNKLLMNLAGRKLVKSFLMTGDELIASQWTEFLNSIS